MKCLDKKRIKLKGGETLALNERIMLSLVSSEVATHLSRQLLQRIANSFVVNILCVLS